jgi:hypothetical protein
MAEPRAVIAAGQTMALATTDTTTVATAIAATTPATVSATIATAIATAAIAGVSGVDQWIEVGRNGRRQHQYASRYGQQSA